jgi:hypothetical protein
MWLSLAEEEAQPVIQTVAATAAARTVIRRIEAFMQSDLQDFKWQPFVVFVTNVRRTALKFVT